MASGDFRVVKRGGILSMDHQLSGLIWNEWMFYFNENDQREVYQFWGSNDFLIFQELAHVFI